MKDTVAELLSQAAAAIGLEVPAAAKVEDSRDRAHGDLAANIALVAARGAGRPPRELAQALIDALPDHPGIARVEIAGPGFINLFLTADTRTDVLRRIQEAGAAYGRSNDGGGRRVLVEFVSANPTGPLHVGHGRGAAYGDCLVRLLRASGWQVDAEYYVNDAGRQMDILTLSVWLRYLEHRGAAVAFPARAYQGDYIARSAERLATAHGDAFLQAADPLFADLPADDADHGDARLDALIQRARETLGTDGFGTIHDHILAEQQDGIAGDLSAFGVEYDHWASERAVVERGEVRTALDRLRDGGHSFERDGALWLASSRFGDDKDRVLLRANGQATYFANDIAYHLDKLERQYDRLIDVWGADHHGYVARMKAAVQALTGQADRLEVKLVQFVSLFRAGEKVAMSTRAGSYETLADLCAEVGRDAARYFYVMRSNDQHLDFDLELATQRSNDNPVYYVQYAHARIHSVFRQLHESGGSYDPAIGLAELGRLGAAAEDALIKLLGRYPEALSAAVRQLAPQLIVHYLRELAEAFHHYYNAEAFLVDDPALRAARLLLIDATRQVLANALDLLGVHAPESM